MPAPEFDVLLAAKASSVRSLDALMRRAHEHPAGVAIRAKRRGQWVQSTWARLGALVQAGASAWTQAGVGVGDRITAIGPLSEALVSTLFAATQLGARVHIPQPTATAPGIADAEVILADGEHELEVVLRHRGARLRLLVVVDPVALHGFDAPNGLRVISFDQLLATGGPEVAAAPIRNAPSQGVAVQDLGFRHTLGAVRVLEGDGALADFAPHSQHGLAWLLTHWIESRALLIIPEPLGNARLDRAEAGARLWIVSAEQLQAFAQDFAERSPEHGVGQWLLRRLLARAGGVINALLRMRLRAALAVREVEAVIFDDNAHASDLQVLVRLGLIGPHRRSELPQVSDAQQHVARALAGGVL